MIGGTTSANYCQDYPRAVGLEIGEFNFNYLNCNLLQLHCIHSPKGVLYKCSWNSLL